MSASSRPRIAAFKQDGATAIPKGSAVKLSTDDGHVTICSATTDKAIGIAQNASTNANDKVEVAIPGGGAKGLAQTTITLGQMLVPHTDGSLKPVSASGDRIIGMAMNSAVAGDLLNVEVVAAVGTAASQ